MRLTIRDLSTTRPDGARALHDINVQDVAELCPNFVSLAGGRLVVGVHRDGAPGPDFEAVTPDREDVHVCRGAA
jgi:hypothetical protein